MNKRILFCISIFLLSAFSYGAMAQTMLYIPDSTWQVYASGHEKTMAFSGGFNNPQFSMGDLNNDGRQDLIVFEKGSLQIKTFLNYGSTGKPDFRYRPEFAQFFPETNGQRAISSYLKIEDLNCDHIPDLLTRGSAGFTIYYGFYLNNHLAFKKYKELFYSPLNFNLEGFDGAIFSPAGWSIKGNGGSTGWVSISANPGSTVYPYHPPSMIMFDAAKLKSGESSRLISKRFCISPNLKQEAKISLWIYRDMGNGNDSVAVYINSDTSLNKATCLGVIARNISINQPDTKAAAGWYSYTFSVPFSCFGYTQFLQFKGTNQGGRNIFMDEISWVSSSCSGDVNAYVDPGGDIPGIGDVDADGDMDFFAFNISGGFINFYKNYQQEEGLPCDSIHVNLKDACWGKVYQSTSIHQTLGVNCPQWQPPNPPAKITHSGNTLCMLDYDGDGDLDYLNGGVSYNTIQLLKNGRVEYNHPRDTIIEQDTAWQTGGQIYQAAQFPAAFFIDLDQDGKKDIIISPSAEMASENYHCIAYYRNTGTLTNPVFSFQSDTALIDQTIDLGTGSYPMLFDYNKDGKIDLFIGGDGYFQADGSMHARLAYYENTSSGNAKSFTLRELNFLNMDSFKTKGVYPAVGDLDNDGLIDLVVGHANGTISFYKNMAASNNVQPLWQLTTTVLKDANGQNIDSAQFAAPFIYDLNKDGKPDLLIGSVTGNVYYYQNMGSVGQLGLQYQTSMLGQVKADSWNLYTAFATPFVGKMDASNNDYLVLGSNSGRISVFSGFQSGNTTIPFQQIDSALSSLNLNLGMYSGFRSVPAFADLDGDGKMEMVLGNVLGGITLFTQSNSTSISSTRSSDSAFIIYPNPARSKAYISWSNKLFSPKSIQFSVKNVAGIDVFNQDLKEFSNRFELSLDGFSQGIYICELNDGIIKAHQKLVVIQ
ncbi:MAG: T9SS type A sorting domain-containing protein [Bacteroidetes bacterium]|nr:T9SS type A sorting domain-containing protein [Bacteroidota bacterium]